MHGHSVFLQTFQLPALVAAVLINLQQLPPQLLLNLNLHAWIVTQSEIPGYCGMRFLCRIHQHLAENFGAGLALLTFGLFVAISHTMIPSISRLIWP